MRSPNLPVEGIAVDCEAAPNRRLQFTPLLILDFAANVMTYAERGVSLETANAQNRNVSKSFLLLGTSFATVEDSAHRTAARNFAQRHRPIAFAAEGLRLALCFAFNCGIRAHYTASSSLE